MQTARDWWSKWESAYAFVRDRAGVALVIPYNEPDPASTGGESGYPWLNLVGIETLRLATTDPTDCFSIESFLTR